MTSKKIRQASWPAIERVLRQRRGVLLDKANRTNTRRYYVNGEFSKTQSVYGERSYRLIDRLLLEPDASRDKWAEWFEESPEHDSTLFFQYQGADGNHLGEYFGENSVFGGREAEIYEYFFKHNPKKSRLDLPVRYLLSVHGSVFHSASRMKLNPYNQSWRLAEQRFSQIRELPASEFAAFNRKSDGLHLAKSICMVEWAYSNAVQFDPALKPMIDCCREFYINTHQTIRDAYEQTLEDKLDLWVEATAAGGKMGICVQYDKPEFLQAILPFLNPETRYPCEAGDPSELVRALPLLTGRNFRVSYHQLGRFWKAGFKVDQFEIVNETTLYLELMLPLGRINLYPAIHYLTCDATNFAEKIKARKNLPGDTVDDKTYRVGNLVYMIEPCLGSRRAGVSGRSSARTKAANGDNKYWLEMGVGTDYMIDTFLEKSIDKELLFSLLGSHDRILSNGCKPMCTERESSIDGFEYIL